MCSRLLAGRRVIITGGAGDIGQSTASLFAGQGARVTLFDLDEARGEACADDIGGAGGEAWFEQVDMTDENAVHLAVERAAAHMDGLDALVSIAGGSGRRWGDGPVADCTVEAWDKTLALNLKTVFLGCKFAIPYLLAQKQSAIVNVASILGLVGGDADFATHAYAASKGAVISLTRAIASYYAPQKLRANVIAPGLIATQMSRRAQESADIRARLSELQPLSADFGQPQDVAQAALYLVSYQSSFVTGAVLTVDGGWTAR